jgi:hypothetical protein
VSHRPPSPFSRSTIICSPDENDAVVIDGRHHLANLAVQRTRASPLLWIADDGAI